MADRWTGLEGVLAGVGRGVTNKTNSANKANRSLVSLAWIAQRWNCSRQTCRRVLQRAGVVPLFLGGDSRNATLRFDLGDVLQVETSAQGVASAGGAR